MKVNFGLCSGEGGCGKANQPMGNMHYKLCVDCNKKRNKNTTSGQTRNEKANNKEQALKDTYEEFGRTTKPICSGCGQTQYLSRSHIIARSARPDLISDINNIVYDCMSRIKADQYGNEGCHSRWESMNLEKMKTLDNFQYRLDYVEEKDEKLYNKITL